MSKPKIISTMVNDDTYRLFGKIREHHQILNSELLRFIMECAIYDDESGDNDYNFSISDTITKKPLTNKIQTSLNEDTYNDFNSLKLAYNMTLSKFLRVVVDVMCTSYFIDQLRIQENEIL